MFKQQQSSVPQTNIPLFKSTTFQTDRKPQIQNNKLFQLDDQVGKKEFFQSLKEPDMQSPLTKLLQNQGSQVGNEACFQSSSSVTDMQKQINFDELDEQLGDSPVPRFMHRDKLMQNQSNQPDSRLKTQLSNEESIQIEEQYSFSPVVEENADADEFQQTLKTPSQQQNQAPLSQVQSPLTISKPTPSRHYKFHAYKKLPKNIVQQKASAQTTPKNHNNFRASTEPCCLDNNIIDRSLSSNSKLDNNYLEQQQLDRDDKNSQNLFFQDQPNEIDYQIVNGFEMQNVTSKLISLQKAHFKLKKQHQKELEILKLNHDHICYKKEEELKRYRQQNKQLLAQTNQQTQELEVLKKENEKFQRYFCQQNERMKILRTQNSKTQKLQGVTDELKLSLEQQLVQESRVQDLEEALGNAIQQLSDLNLELEQCAGQLTSAQDRVQELEAMNYQLQSKLSQNSMTILSQAGGGTFNCSKSAHQLINRRNSTSSMNTPGKIQRGISSTSRKAQDYSDFHAISYTGQKVQVKIDCIASPDYEKQVFATEPDSHGSDMLIDHRLNHGHIFQDETLQFNAEVTPQKVNNLLINDYETPKLVESSKSYQNLHMLSSNRPQYTQISGTIVRRKAAGCQLTEQQINQNNSYDQRAVEQQKIVDIPSNLHQKQNQLRKLFQFETACQSDSRNQFNFGADDNLNQGENVRSYLNDDDMEFEQTQTTI